MDMYGEARSKHLDSHIASCILPLVSGLLAFLFQKKGINEPVYYIRSFDRGSFSDCSLVILIISDDDCCNGPDMRHALFNKR